MLRFFALLTIIAPFISCKKEKVDKDPFYFRATINGTAIEWIAPFPRTGDPRPQFMCAIPRPGSRLPFSCNLSSELRYQELSGTSIYKENASSLDFSNSIQVAFTRSTNDIVVDFMEHYYTNGPKTFGLLREQCSDPVLEGIIISYWDANGKRWESSWGDQSTNVFEQVSLQPETRTDEYRKKWKAKFSCKLYDGAGNSVEITNAEIYGPAISI